MEATNCIDTAKKTGARYTPFVCACGKPATFQATRWAGVLHVCVGCTATTPNAQPIIGMY